MTEPKPPGRRPSRAGLVSVVLDFRSADSERATTDATFWNRLEDVSVLVSLLVELCGPDCEVLFDFGQATIRNVDLGALAKRVKAADPKPTDKS